MSVDPHSAHAASDPKRSAWVSANAGAGKTFTLANRVTRLLLDKVRPERILCLTYTKAAAAEMAGRLFGQLGDWAMASDADLADRIVAIGAEPRDTEGLREARRLFALALETPGGLKIQTIHSFCQYLLARFPLEAGVPPAFRILDDETGRELRDESRARVLERAGSGNEELAEAAARFVTETSETQLHDMLNAALGSERRKLERFLAGLPDAAIGDAVRAAHGAQAGDTPESIETSFCAEIRNEERQLREVVEWLSGGKANDKKLAQSLLSALQANVFDAFAEIFLTGNGEPRKRLASKDLIADNPHIYFYFESVGARLVAAEDRRRAAKAAALAQAALTLIRAVRDEYQAAKRARAALDYDDLIVTAQQLLERRDAAQWVLYKLDGGLDHVLIDEAQDTSPEQWAIVTRLTEEFFAGEGIDKNKRSPRTIFAVGDEKQSIFSFQGAEPREFDVHRRHFAGRIAADAFADVRLDMSRRSTPEVLSFVDEVFATPDARAGVTSNSEPIAHRTHRENDRGRVEFWPALSATKIPEPDYWRPVDVPSETSPVMRLADQIATHIKSWTDGRTRLPGHKDPVRPGDIMVLMPRREPFASALIRELKARGVPVAGADRIRLDKQIAVMDLIALGRFVLLPEDDLNLAALLRSPLLGLSEDALFALSAQRNGSLWQELLRRQSDNVAFTQAAQFLSACLARADYAPPYEFYASVLSAHGVRARLLTRLGAEANDAIDEFLSLALTYEALNTPSLEGFLHWIEHGEAEIKRDMERGRNEVRVMTVHGAKGLEADIVILPDTTSLPDSPGRRGNILYTDDGPVFPIRDEIAPEAVKRAKDAAHEKALEEHRRLLYVALTRARDRLYICGFENKRGVKEGSWYALAQRAAQAIGEPVARADETLRILGNAEFETAPLADAAIRSPLQLDGWARETAPVERERPRLIRPSDATGVEEPGVLSPVGARNAQRFRRGNLVHALLARLPEIARELRHDAASAFLAARNVAGPEAEALIAETLAVIDEAAFAPGARAEVAVVADLPELGEGARVSGRIDRLAVSDTEVLAVDFKTNRPPPLRVEDVPKLYIVQMALYRAALARIFPGRRIACALVWTEGPSLMTLDETLLETALGLPPAAL